MATLKIIDLSVGDWVYYDKGNTPYSIRGIYRTGTGDCVVLNDDKYSDGVIAFVGKLTPIPITAEILKKNGWRNDGMYAILRIDEHRHLEYYFHEHRLRKYFCGVDEWQAHAKVNDITFAVHCYSVHQLQHALRLAGGEKEIVMPNK